MRLLGDAIFGYRNRGSRAGLEIQDQVLFSKGKILQR